MSKNLCTKCGKKMTKWTIDPNDTEAKSTPGICLGCLNDQRRETQSPTESHDGPRELFAPQADVPITMKHIGIGLIIIGLFFGIIEISLDSSVSTERKYGAPERVVNLSKMEQRQTILSVSGLLILTGSFFTGIGVLREGQPESERVNKLTDTRSCPFCAEDIKIAAKICKHCQRDVADADAEYNPSE